MRCLRSTPHPRLQTFESACGQELMTRHKVMRAQGRGGEIELHTQQYTGLGSWKGAGVKGGLDTALDGARSSVAAQTPYPFDGAVFAKPQRDSKLGRELDCRARRLRKAAFHLRDRTSHRPMQSPPGR